MKTYVLTVAGAVLLSAVVAVIAPGGRTGRMLKGMTRLLILSVMLTPFLSLIKGEPTAFSSEPIGEDAAYLDRCAELLERADEAEVSAFLEERFRLSAEVDVVRGRETNFPRKKVAVKLSGEGIIGEDERIYIVTDIKAAVEAQFSCAAEVVF